MQPLHKKPKHRCIAAAQDQLRQSLSWLRGYPRPTTDSRPQSWQPAPPRHRRDLAFPPPIALDSELLRSSYRALHSLPKLFPKALPLALRDWESLESWQRSLNLRLDLIAQLIHQSKPLPGGRDLWAALGLDPKLHRQVLQLYDTELGAELSSALAWRLADAPPSERLAVLPALEASFEAAARALQRQLSCSADLVQVLLRFFDLVTEAPADATLWLQSLADPAFWNSRSSHQFSSHLAALRQALKKRPFGEIPSFPEPCHSTRIGPKLCHITLDLERASSRELPIRLRILGALLPRDELRNRYEFSERLRQLHEDLAFDRRRHGSLAHNPKSPQRLDELEAAWTAQKLAYFPTHSEETALDNAANTNLPFELLRKLADSAPKPQGQELDSKCALSSLSRTDLRALCLTMADPCPKVRASFRGVLPTLSSPLLGLLHEVLALRIDDLLCAMETAAEQAEWSISRALSLLPKLLSALAYARRRRLSSPQAPLSLEAHSNSIDLLLSALAYGASPEEAWDFTAATISEVNDAIPIRAYPRLLALCQLDPKLALSIAASKLDLLQLPQPPALTQWHKEPELQVWLRNIFEIARPEDLSRALSAIAKLADRPPAFPRAAPLDSIFPEDLQLLAAQVLGFQPSSRPKLISKLNLHYCDMAAAEREIAALEQRLRLDPSNSQRQKRLANLRSRLDRSPSPPSPRKLQKWKNWLETKLSKAIADQLETIARAQFEAETRLLLSLPKGAKLCASLEEAPKPLNRYLKALLSRRLGPPPWDLRDHPDNARALQSLASSGLQIQHWIEPSEPFHQFVKEQHWTFAIEHDPLLTLQMGELFDTCLGFDGCNFQSTIVNVIDINKQVLYGRVHGQIRARVLLGLSADARLIPFRLYAHEPCDELFQAVRAVLDELARRLGAPLSSPSDPRDGFFGVRPILSQEHYIDPCGSPLLSPQARLESGGKTLEELEKLSDDEILSALEQTFAQQLLDPNLLFQLLQLKALERPSLRLRLLYKIPEARRSPQNLLEIAEAEINNNQLDHATAPARRLLSNFPSSQDLADDFWPRCALVSRATGLASQLRKIALRALHRKDHNRSGALSALAICARSLHRHKRARQFAKDALEHFIPPNIRPIIESILQSQEK